MSAYTLTISESKLGYGVAVKCNALRAKAHALMVYGLAEFFPDALTQFDNIRKLMDLAVASKVAWTGQSQTTSDSVPDSTMIPPNVEINKAIIMAMNNKADSLGVTLSPAYEFNDADSYFTEANETWSGAAKIFIDILGLAEQLDMYRFMLSDLWGGASPVSRSPAQLIPFGDSDIPLCGNAWPDSVNWNAISGIMDVDVTTPGIKQVLTDAPEIITQDQAVSGVAKANVSGNARYTFTATGGYGVIMCLSATAGASSYTNVVYTSASSGYITIADYDTAPATADFTLRCIKAAV